MKEISTLILIMILAVSVVRARVFLPYTLSTILNNVGAMNISSKRNNYSTNQTHLITHNDDDHKSLTIKEEVIYQGFRNMVKRTIKLPNQKLIEIEVLKHRHESVVVFSWNSLTKTTTLIREYHPGPEQSLYGTVAGMYESAKHHSALECAQHELEEEAQLQTSNWFALLEENNRSMPFDKYSNNRFYPFLALDCTKVDQPRPLDEEEFITVYENVSYREIMELIQLGKMNVVSTYTCLLAFKKLEELGIDYK